VRAGALDRLRALGLWRLVRFGLTGCAGFAVDFTTLITLRSVVGVSLAVATATGTLVGGSVHYSLTRLWVFPHESQGGELGKVARYVALAAANMIATVVIVVSLDALGLDYRAAKIVAVVVLFFSNYALTPRWVMPVPSLTEEASRNG
jgi:putative flippase GtrA